MSEVESSGVLAREPELRHWLEGVLREKNLPAIVAVDGVRSGGLERLGSYENEILTVRLAGGDQLKLFLKDFGRSKLPKDAAADRRERERRVYAELLEEAELGTAGLYGAHWDEAAARFWLLLEFVDGEQLWYCGFEHYLEAAAWLGRMHGRFAGQQSRLRACEFLMRQDAAFFFGAAERALEAVSSLSDELARRLAGVLEGYDEIVAVLSREPETLVHGSYRPENVLVVRSSASRRICPTDWELAALGRSTYDLAFLCDGYRPPELDALFDAYERGAKSSGFGIRDRDELTREVDCFRLHKLVNSLGHLRQWPRPTGTATKVLAAAEELAGTLRRQ
jgi:aminoglycoside phosphotransferase (APT) family kinase protein